jgi:predicted DNA-binding transcriptional regulator AlpA
MSNMNDRLIPDLEVRHRLGRISKPTLYRLRREIGLPVVKIGRRNYVRESEVELLIKRLEERQGLVRLPDNVG